MTVAIDIPSGSALASQARWARWHADLSEMASEPHPGDARLAAAKLAHVHLALLALVPAIRKHEELGPLKRMSAWIRDQLTEVSVDSLHYLASGKGDAVEQRVYQRMAEGQSQAAAAVTQALHDRGLVPMVVKGAELRHRVMGGRAISSSSDVDVLVAPGDIERARSTLQEIGFSHSAYDPNTGRLVPIAMEKVLAHEATHRELYPLCRLSPLALSSDEIQYASARRMMPLFVYQGQALLMEIIDLHKSLFIRMEVDSLFQRAVPSHYAGAVTLSLTDHVWTTALRFYLESSTIHQDPKHRDLAYLVALLNEPGIDWNLLVQTVASADLRPALFYALRLLTQLGVAEVPNWVMDALHVRRGSSCIDFGCRVTRALGLVEGLPQDLRPYSPQALLA
ncbi:nucleotidyltransferase family protein [Roseateles sp. DB2]|uniref:nucleotidyltransferase family protein n=1 Tax=Roseateles sp. DB2 TaxID=3453717 RepID=UPI003EEB18DC